MNTNEINELIAAERAETDRLKAEAIVSRNKAEESKAWWALIQNHSGHNGLNHGIYYDCQANQKMISDYLVKCNLPITVQTVETAYVVLFNAGKLATASEEMEYVTGIVDGKQVTRLQRKYERKTDTRVSRAPLHLTRPESQLRVETYAPVVVPFTRAELLAFAKTNVSAFKAAIKKYGSKAIDAVLQS